MLYEALRIAAGKHNFMAGDMVELPESDAKELLAAGAIAPVDRKTGAVQVVEKPASKPKKVSTTKKTDEDE